MGKFAAPTLALVAALATLLTGCGGGTPHPSAGSSTSPTASPSQAATPIRYVALGDSYTAAPFVPITDVADGCFRSDHNYPHLLAARLGAYLVDVSCGGASTADVDGRQRTGQSLSVAPQIRAVSPAAELITVGLGGNDGDLFARLVGQCPLTGPQGGMDADGGATCRAPDEDAARTTLARTRTDLTRTLREVQRQAPKAHVLLVGYPRLVGEQGCAALPILPGSEAAFDRVTRMLRDTQRAAARSAGVDFVDLYAASAGHDVCSKQPWVNGVRTDTKRAVAVHPFLAGEQAMARQVESRLPDTLLDRADP